MAQRFLSPTLTSRNAACHSVKVNRRLFLALASAAAAFGQDQPSIADLKPQTGEAFRKYVAAREEAISRERLHGSKFLWADETAERQKRVRGGEVVVESVPGHPTVEIKGGLIHDWVGAVFIPGATLQKTLRTVQNYDNHKNWFKPEVIDSKIESHKGDEYHIFLRLLKKKVITVVLNTRHAVRYYPMDAQRAHSRSYSTSIREVSDAGKPGEHELAPGKDHGFLWRLFSYWRFQERDGGVYVECEAISLTRGIPTGLGWIVSPIIRDLPVESLQATLANTRKAVGAA